MVLSCVKHSGGSTAAKMDEQLAADLTSWGLDEKCFIAIVTDMASNMNLLCKLTEEKYPATKHHYCTDHNLQLTAVKAYSGNIALQICNDAFPDGTECYDIVGALKKVKAFISHVRQLRMSKAKLDDAQRQVFAGKPVCVLIQAMKTWWCLTHMILERIVDLRDPIKDMFWQEF